MSRQITNILLMVRPIAFELNEQTAVNNYFQTSLPGLTSEQIQTKARNEFDQFVNTLREEGVDVIVVNDTLEPSTPDSIFPNNWNSSHENGTFFMYPMFAENRRLERRPDIVDLLKKDFHVSEFIDLSFWESKEKYLEGTGSMVLDRENQLIYAAIAERTHPEVLNSFAELTDCGLISFTANQTVGSERMPIYHTNVMMCVGEKFALFCADSIDDQEERQAVFDSFEKTGKEIITITESQKNQFAGNMLQVFNDKNERLIVMSLNAFNSLTQDQINILQKHGKLVYSDINTIEVLGGGSARCMMDEIFLRRK